MLIAGKSVVGRGPVIAVDDPSTGAVVAEIPSADLDQVDAAVAAATAAFGEWSAMAQGERSEGLRRVALRIGEIRDELATLLTTETGRPFTRNLLYVDFAAAVFRQYAELARLDAGRLAPGNDPGEWSMVLRAPFGVVAGIVPFNYPLDLLVFKAAPALAVGNTFIAKPHPLTPLTTLRLADIFASELPDGVASVVVGDGEIGRLLVEHSGVDMVAFTGSTAAGTAIGSTCARLAKPAHLEMGGKDPAVVFEDADLEQAIHGVVWAAFLNAGQVCTSTERAYVHRSLYDEFVDGAVELAASLVVGDPMDERTDVGPMRTEAGRARVVTQLEQARGAGVEVATGGEALPRPGYFLSPAVVTGADHSMALMREETFGPVLPIVPFDDVDEALQLASDTPYGLGASIYTHDPALVYRAAQELRVGNLWVNDPVVDNPGAPFGGMRASGTARELGIEGLHAFTAPRHVLWNTDRERKPWWYTNKE